MSEPKAIVEGLAQAREALRSAKPPPDIRDAVDDDDLDALRSAREHGLSEMREARWRVMCPQRFHRSTLDWTRAQHGDDMADTIVEWRSVHPRPNLVILGPVGTGKTSTAIAACRDDWIERGVEMLFMPLGRLLDQLRPGGPEGVYEEAVHAGRLVVDDFGQERPSDWTRERIDLIINDRWLEEAPTIVTSNLPPDAFRNAVGERLYSRLAGNDAYVLTLGGGDRRQS